MRNTCVFLCASGLVSVSISVSFVIEAYEMLSGVKREKGVGRDEGVGRREVRIEPMEAIVISPGPMTSATRIPKIQNPCQSAIKSQTPHCPASGPVLLTLDRWLGLEESSASSPSRIEA